MSLECRECGRYSPEVAHGLRICVGCSAPIIGDQVANDAVARAVAALLCDVVEEHGTPNLDMPPGASTDHYGPAKAVKVSPMRQQEARARAIASQPLSDTEAMARIELALAKGAADYARVHGQQYAPPAGTIEKMLAGWQEQPSATPDNGCRHCSTELLSDESKSRGTCFDCREKP